MIVVFNDTEVYDCAQCRSNDSGNVECLLFMMCQENGTQGCESNKNKINKKMNNNC